MLFRKDKNRDKKENKGTCFSCLICVVVLFCIGMLLLTGGIVMLRYNEGDFNYSAHRPETCIKGHADYNKNSCYDKTKSDEIKHVLLNVGIVCVLLSLLCLIPAIVLSIVMCATRQPKKSGNIGNNSHTSSIATNVPNAYDYFNQMTYDPARTQTQSAK